MSINNFFILASASKSRSLILKNLGLNFMTVQSLFPEPRRPVPTLKDAILDIQEDEENKEAAEFLREDIKKRPKYEWMHLLPKDDINNPWPVKQGAAYEELGQYVPGNKYFQTRRIGWNVPSNTLTETGQTTGMCGLIHPEEDRQYTVKECLRIMSLPDDYKFHETEKLDSKYRRIGLMVAPYHMMHNANSLYEKVLCKT